MIIHKVQNPHKYNKEQSSYYLTFIDCGLIHAPKNWMHKKRFLDKYELIYVTQGNLFLQIDNISITLEENNVIIIPPYKTISGTQESLQKTSFFWLDFLTDNADNYGVITQQTQIKEPSVFYDLLKELTTITQLNNICDFTKDSFLLLLFYQIKKSIEENSPKHLIVLKICNYIEKNISQPLTVEMVADALKYNKDYLCRAIKSYYGISLKDYINKQKINLSKKLLITSNYSIKDISDLLGYYDSNLFTKYFKYHEKMSPTQFRNSHVK